MMTPTADLLGRTTARRHARPEAVRLPSLLLEAIFAGSRDGAGAPAARTALQRDQGNHAGRARSLQPVDLDHAELAVSTGADTALDRVDVAAAEHLGRTPRPARSPVATAASLSR